MEGLRIFIYGQAKTGKSMFVKKVKGVERNNIDYLVPDPFPVIYVHNDKPENIENFDIVLQFNKDGVTFEKGVLVNSN